MRDAHRLICLANLGSVPGALLTLPAHPQDCGTGGSACDFLTQAGNQLYVLYWIRSS